MNSAMDFSQPDTLYNGLMPSLPVAPPMDADRSFANFTPAIGSTAMPPRDTRLSPVSNYTATEEVTARRKKRRLDYVKCGSCRKDKQKVSGVPQLDHVPLTRFSVCQQIVNGHSVATAALNVNCHVQQASEPKTMRSVHGQW